MDSIYVLILNYQSFLDTIKYVDCIQKQENINLNILIVDNFSPNNSFSILQEEFSKTSNVEVISTKKNGGYAYGINYGLRYLEDKKVDFILVSNNDIEISNTTLLFEMGKSHRKLKKVGFIAPWMLDNGVKSKITAWKVPSFMDEFIGSLSILEFFLGGKNFYRGRQIYSREHLEKMKPVECLSGAFFLAEKNVFYDIGLFDENIFLYMEESIMGLKTKRMGLKNYILNDLEYNHLVSKTIENEFSNLNMYKYLLESKIYFYKEYLKTNKFGIFLLKCLFQVWKIESYFVRKIKLIPIMSSFIQNRSTVK